MANDASKKRPRGDLLASLDAAFAAKQAAPASKYTAQAAQVQAQANNQQAYLHTKRKKKNSSNGATISNGSGRGAAAGPKGASVGDKQPAQQAPSSNGGAKRLTDAKRSQDPLYGKLDVDVLRLGLKNCSLLPQVKTLHRQYVLSATLKSYLDTATQNGGKSVEAAADKLKNKVLQLDNPGEMPFSDAEKLCAIWQRYVRDAIGWNSLDPADEINPRLVGVSGIVVAEKQQVLQLCTPSNRIITLPKLGSRFRVVLDDQRVVQVEGVWLLQRSNNSSKA
ncbi:hypothetical protein PybrP1_003074 [[Pythium] brassicae (nom. inval.)]|nr:hypothetical protein PybrP1_003074 [[Pythium] brassicae (nom. inval.)]